MHSRPRTVTPAWSAALLRGATIATLLAAAAVPAMAVQQTFFFEGVVDSSGFADAPGGPLIPDPLPPGTPVSGSYSFDDAATDTNGDADLGSFATGEFFLDFGDVGTISFDVSGTIGVNNDQEAFFPGFFQDSFSIRTAGGTQSTTFSNAVLYGQSSVSFIDSIPQPTPDALSGDDLTAVPQVAGAPWEGTSVGLRFSASGDAACGPFESSCAVIITITQITDEPPAPPVPTLPPAGVVALITLLAAGALWALRMRS